jgi:hypothetical protein
MESSESESESKYFVHWNEEISASSPEDAARRALAMLRDPEARGLARSFSVHANARDLSIEVSASGVTAHVLWDSAEQTGEDGEYTADFYTLPPLEQLQWRITHYLMERLIIPETPDDDGWKVDCVNQADAVQADPLITEFVINTPPDKTGPSFRVTIQPYVETAPSSADVTDE